MGSKIIFLCLSIATTYFGYTLIHILAVFTALSIYYNAIYKDIKIK